MKAFSVANRGKKEEGALEAQLMPPKSAPKQPYKGKSGKRRKQRNRNAPQRTRIESAGKHVLALRAVAAKQSKQGCRAIAQAIALPYTVERRLPIGQSATALMRTTQTGTLKIRATDPPFADLSKGDTVAFLIGLPGLSMAHWQTISTPDSVTVGPYRCMELCYFSADANSVKNSSESWMVANTTDSNVPVITQLGDQGQIAISDSPIEWPLWACQASTGLGSYTKLGAFHGRRTPLGMHENRSHVFLNTGDVLLLCQLSVVKMEQSPWADSFELRSSYSFRAYNALGNEDTNREGQIIRTFMSPIESDMELYDFTFYYATQPVWVSVMIDSLVIIGPPATLSAAKPRMGRVSVQARVFRNVQRGVLFTTGTATETNSPDFFDFWTGQLGTWQPYAQSYGYWALVSSNMFYTEDGGDPLIGQEVRTVGASLLITNTSPQATQGGIIHTARLKGKQFHEYSLADFAMTRGYSSALQAAQGVYTFVVPEEERLRYQRVIEGGYDTSPRFDLSFLRTSYVHGIIITSTVPLLATTADVDAGTAGVAPSTFRYTVDEQFEFQTSSRRYNARPHSDSITDLDEVLCMFNSNSEWFYENPQHLEKLYAMLRGAATRAWRGVKFALPYVAPAITAANPALGPLIHALQGLAH